MTMSALKPPVVTGLSGPQSLGSATPVGTGRFRVVAIQDCEAVRIVYAHYYKDGTNPQEASPGNTINLAGAIEVAGRTYPVTWGEGSTATVDCADGGYVISNPVTISLRRGQSFYVRTDWDSGVGNYCYNLPYSVTNGYDNYVSGSRLSTGVGTGGLTGTVSLNGPQPIAIIADDPVGMWPSVAVLADSVSSSGDISFRRNGLSDDDYGYRGYNGGGWPSRLFRTHGIGIVDVTFGGERAYDFAGDNCARRLPLISGCRYWVIQYGRNDLGGGATAANIITYLEAIGTLATDAGAIPVYATIPPKTSMTAGHEAEKWGTANQEEASGSQNAARITVNAWIRTHEHYFDVADVVETARDSGIWKVGPVQYSGAATAGGNTTIDMAAQPWESAQFATDMVCEITGGLGSGQVRKISTNTTTQITVDTAWTTNPDATSTWAVRPVYSTDGTHPSFYSYYLISRAMDVSWMLFADAANVVSGVDRGDATLGTYPTTLTTQTADKDAIEAATLDTDGTDSVIALPNGVNATAGTALVYAAGVAEGEGHIQDACAAALTATLNINDGVVDADVKKLAGGTYKIASTTGNWGTAGTWADAAVPVAGDNIIIRDGITVSVAATLDLGQFGTLELQGDGLLDISSGTVAVVPRGWNVNLNLGTVTTNFGTIKTNFGPVTTNFGTVASNWSTVTNNNLGGTVTNNYGTVTGSSGGGTVTNNYVTVTTNGGTVTNNYGTVTTNSDDSIVTLNIGTVTTNNVGGTVFGGTVTTNNGNWYKHQTGDCFPNVDALEFLNGRVKAVTPPTHGTVGGSEFQFALSATVAEGLVVADAGESTADVQEDDRYKHTTTHTDPTVGTQWLIEAEVLQHDPAYDGVATGDPAITLSSSNEAIQTIDAAGLTHYVSAGSVEFIATSAATDASPAQVVSTGALTSGTNEPATYDTVTYTDDPGSCREDASDAIDSRIAVGGKQKTIYSSQDHTTPAYVRNANCWAADLDLTCISPWNSTGANYRAGTLISPRHIVFAKHYPIGVGATIRFVKADNTVVTRTLLAKTDVAADITVGVLSADVSAGIGFAKVLPADYATYLPNGGQYIPVFGLDYEEKALVRDITDLDGSSRVVCQAPTDATRLAFYESTISGDSGNPLFMVVNDELVILCCWWYGGPGSGPAIHAYRAEINAAMSALDTANGFTPDQTLTDVDLTAFNTY